MDKATWRQALRKARQAMTAQERAWESQEACQRLRQWPTAQVAQVILSYAAQAQELDLTAFHRWAWEQGKTLAFPVSGPEGRMEAYAPDCEAGLAPGRFGILEPQEPNRRYIAPETVDLVLVPCVAVDARGCRLGQGGGYYDRYLPRCPQAVTVAAAFSVQQVECLPGESHDAPVAYVVTAQGLWKT
jgi:5-formyltetrahydrofolate cyclo-ligase